MSPSTLMQSSGECRRFVEAAGHATQSFGFGRILGQVYALLYLSPKPMCLDELALELGVSKASVSTTIRQLERWSAVRRVWIKGDRKDYYEAETDFREVFRRGLLASLRKKFETAGVQISGVEESVRRVLAEVDGEEKREIELIAERLRRAKDFHAKVQRLLDNPLLDHLV